MNFKEWVPDKVRVLLYLTYLVAFQFSNGFYFTTMAQLVGERNLTMSDTHMFGQTVLTGLCFYFPLAFRLKFRFTNMTSLTIAATCQLCINLIFPHVTNYWGILALCYLGGFFRQSKNRMRLGTQPRVQGQGAGHLLRILRARRKTV